MFSKHDLYLRTEIVSKLRLSMIRIYSNYIQYMLLRAAVKGVENVSLQVFLLIYCQGNAVILLYNSLAIYAFWLCPILIDSYF
jgi:hypothetical protein